jgi:hypothetical protein
MSMCVRSRASRARDARARPIRGADRAVLIRIDEDPGALLDLGVRAADARVASGPRRWRPGPARAPGGTKSVAVVEADNAKS